MRSLLLCFLSVYAFAQPPAPARITVFREKDPGSAFVAAHEQLFYANREYVDSRYPFSLFLDDAFQATFHPGRFVTFTVPAGRHTIRTKRSETLTLDLKPGERVYVRPGLRIKVSPLWRRTETMAQISSCRDLSSLLAGQVPAPLKAQDLYSARVADEPAFPACLP